MWWRQDPLRESMSWVPSLGEYLDLPVSKKDILGFGKWIYDDPYPAGVHKGLDLIEYLDEDDIIHHGLDPNTPVRAIANGRVHEILSDGYYGFITIRHNSYGLASGYCHLTPSVKLGQRIRKGEIIGRVSQSNGTVPVHLHLDLGNCDRSQPSKKYGHDGRYKYLVDLVTNPELILPIEMTKQRHTTKNTI